MFRSIKGSPGLTVEVAVMTKLFSVLAIMYLYLNREDYDGGGDKVDLGEFGSERWQLDLIHFPLRAPTYGKKVAVSILELYGVM